MRCIIGLVGEKAAGKGTVAAYLKDKYDASVFVFSASMKACLERLGLPITRDNLIRFSELTREAFGEDLYARVMAKDVTESDAEMIVVDGIRREADISKLRDVPGFLLVYVTAPLETRYARAKERGEKGEGEMSLEEFTAQESASTETGIAALATQADLTLDNSGTFDELYRQVEGLIISVI